MAAIPDHMAAVSYGTYPTPTPTMTQRAAFGASYGLLNLVPTYVSVWTDIILQGIDAISGEFVNIIGKYKER